MVVECQEIYTSSITLGQIVMYIYLYILFHCNFFFQKIILPLPFHAWL